MLFFVLSFIYDASTGLFQFWYVMLNLIVLWAIQLLCSNRTLCYASVIQLYII